MQTKIKLSDLMERYEKALAEHGQSYASRLKHMQTATSVIRNHENQGSEYLEDSLVAECTAELTERYNNGKMIRKSYHDRVRELERFINYAKSGEIVLPYPLRGSRSEPTALFLQISDEFAATISNVNTQCDARWVTHKYFVWLTGQGFDDLRGVGAEQIQMFLLYCSKKLAQNSMHDVKLYLRKLYAFLYESERSESDYNTLLSFPVNRESKIYPALPRADISKLLDSIDRKTKSGKRNYAIMILGTVLGLRACDIAALRLTDIDWRHGEIKITQAKTGNSVVLPLTADVGVALKNYILNARPKTTEPRIFLRIHSPHTALASAVTLGDIAT